MTVTSQPLSPASENNKPINWAVVIAAAIALFGGAYFIHANIAGAKTAIYLLGGLMGIALYHASFGFTSGWRHFVINKRGAGMRAQMLTFAIAAIVILPILQNGELFGHGVIGANAPVGVAMLLGAFMFGFGMQLGGGCASGTLYTVGGGSTRMVITLLFFMAGSVIGSAHLPWWFTTPHFTSGTLLQAAGLYPTIAMTLILLGFIAWLTILIERKAHGTLQHGGRPQATNQPFYKQLLRGPWPLIWGGIALALGNIAVISLTGHTWSISFGYTLWGAKALGALGIDLSHTEFWTWGYPSRALKGSLFAEDTSAMNFGIIFGAALAAGLAGKFGTFKKIPLKSIAAAIIGGLLMGYGARLASGCNIGALFSGIASGSYHGWAWLVSGFIGSYFGILARPFFRL